MLRQRRQKDLQVSSWLMGVFVLGELARGFFKFFPLSIDRGVLGLRAETMSAW